MEKEKEFVGEYYKVLPFRNLKASDFEDVKHKLFQYYIADLFPYRNMDYPVFYDRVRHIAHLDKQLKMFQFLGSYITDFDQCDCCECFYCCIQLDEEKTKANIDSCFEMFNLCQRSLYDLLLMF